MLNSMQKNKLSLWLAATILPGILSAHEFSGSHGTVVVDWSVPVES